MRHNIFCPRATKKSNFNINVNEKKKNKKKQWKLKNTTGRENIWSALYNNVNTQHFMPVWVRGNGSLERAGKNVGYVYAWVNGRGQHGNSGRTNPRTGQRRLTQDRFALFVFRLSAFEHDKSASAHRIRMATLWQYRSNQSQIAFSALRANVNSAVHVAMWTHRKF